MSSLLTLLLLFGVDTEVGQLSTDSIEVSDEILHGMTSSIVKRSRLSYEQVGLTQEVIGEALHQAGDSVKPGVDLMKMSVQGLLISISL